MRRCGCTCPVLAGACRTRQSGLLSGRCDVGVMPPTYAAVLKSPFSSVQTFRQIALIGAIMRKAEQIKTCSSRVWRNCDDYWMVGEREFDRTNIIQSLNWPNSDRRVVNHDRRVCDGQTHLDSILAGRAFSPDNEFEGFVTALQEQIMNGIGLIRDREVELASFDERGFVGQNGCQIVQVDRRPPR